MNKGNLVTHGASGYGNYGCRCTTCREGWREQTRRYRKTQPSKLVEDIEALEMQLELLREENAALRCRLDELEHLDDDGLPTDDEILPSLTR